jgi:hypothetical protein
MKTNYYTEHLRRFLLVILVLLYGVNASFAAAVILNSFGNFSKPFVALDDFNRLPSCKTTGIIRKFLSWGDGRSDTIARGLFPLANEIRRYSALHRKIMRSWDAGSPVRVIKSYFQHSSWQPRLPLSFTDITHHFPYFMKLNV